MGIYTHPLVMSLLQPFLCSHCITCFANESVFDGLLIFFMYVNPKVGVKMALGLIFHFFCNIKSVVANKLRLLY